MFTSEGKKNRRYPRIATPYGVWASVQTEACAEIVKVLDLNLGGAFLSIVDNPPDVGQRMKLLLSVQEGEIRIVATVRNRRRGEGVGVEFVSMEPADWQRLLQLIKRLLEAEVAEDRAAAAKSEAGSQSRLTRETATKPGAYSN